MMEVFQTFIAPQFLILQLITFSWLNLFSACLKWQFFKLVTKDYPLGNYCIFFNFCKCNLIWPCETSTNIFLRKLQPFTLVISKYGFKAIKLCTTGLLLFCILSGPLLLHQPFQNHYGKWLKSNFLIRMRSYTSLNLDTPL